MELNPIYFSCKAEWGLYLYEFLFEIILQIYFLFDE